MVILGVKKISNISSSNDYKKSRQKQPGIYRFRRIAAFVKTCNLHYLNIICPLLQSLKIRLSIIRQSPLNSIAFAGKVFKAMVSGQGNPWIFNRNSVCML